MGIFAFGGNKPIATRTGDGSTNAMKSTNAIKSAIPTIVIVLSWLGTTKPLDALNFQGTINTNNAAVAGDVTVSSMTVSTLTVSNLMDVQGSITGIKGLVLQMISSSTVVASTTTSSTLVAIPGMSANITLSNSNNYVRISFSGLLQATSLSTSHTPEAHVSLARDLVDLGNGALATTRNDIGMAVGYTMIDAPGDTLSHTYSVTFDVSNSMTEMATFTASPIGYLLVEEISR